MEKVLADFESDNQNPNLAGERMLDFAKELYPHNRSLMGPDIRFSLEKFIDKNPEFEVLNFKTGEIVFDWEIPLEWNIKEAWIKDSKGNKIIDFNENNLHLVSYSIPIKKIISWPELKKHLHLHKEISDAIPYRTTYYKKDWGFCVTHKQFELLESLQGDFQINIGSELKDGSLSYGELILKGKSKKEILISCYICHPSMANDSLSGVLLAAFLANYIKSFRLIWIIYSSKIYKLSKFQVFMIFKSFNNF